MGKYNQNPNVFAVESGKIADMVKAKIDEEIQNEENKFQAGQVLLSTTIQHLYSFLLSNAERTGGLEKAAMENAIFMMSMGLTLKSMLEGPYNDGTQQFPS